MHCLLMIISYFLVYLIIDFVLYYQYYRRSLNLYLLWFYSFFNLNLGKFFSSFLIVTKLYPLIINIIPTNKNKKKQGESCCELQAEHKSLHSTLLSILHNNPKPIKHNPIIFSIILPFFVCY